MTTWKVTIEDVRMDSIKVHSIVVKAETIDDARREARKAVPGYHCGSMWIRPAKAQRRW